VATVGLVELLQRTRLVREDAAIGLVFPVFFSIGVILVSRYARHVHLDTDAVFAGEPAYAPLQRLSAFGWDLGPEAMYLIGAILVVNVLVLLLFYKELKLATFDTGLAIALGFSPALLHYGLMTMVSVSVVGAFEVVGSPLVVALMIGPPAAAYLLTDRLSRMLLGSAVIGVAAAAGGYWMAHFLDASIAGCIAVMTGVCFALAFLLAPQRGLLAVAYRRYQQRWEFAQTMLVMHLLNHEGLPEADREMRFDELHLHLRWNRAWLERVADLAESRGLVSQCDAHMVLTDAGRARARNALVA
jgi:manganese/zinc/iron transport system permease protein